MSTTVPFRGGLASLRRKAAVIAALTLASAGMPLVMAAPAEAATANGCTVTAKRAYEFNRYTIDYPTDLRCGANRRIQIEDQTWQRSGRNSHWQNTYYSFNFNRSGARTIHNLEREYYRNRGYIEVYHCVRFHVYHNGRWDSWTRWECSPHSFVRS